MHCIESVLEVWLIISLDRDVYDFDFMAAPH